LTRKAPKELASSIAEALPAPALALDAEGRVAWTNAAGRARLGLRAGGTSGPAFADLWAGAGPAPEVAALRAQGSRLLHLRLRDADGASFDTEASVVPLDAPCPGGALLLLREESQVALETLFPDPDQTGGPFLRISREGLLLYANTLAAPVLEHWGTAVGRPVPGPAAAAVAHGLETGRWQRLRTRAGGRLFDLGVTPLASGNQAVVYGEDITELSRANEALQRLTSAVEQADYTVLITDRDGNIEYVNTAWEHTTGWTRREAIGQNPRLIKSGEHDREFFRHLWDTILSGRTYRGRVINRRRSGETYLEEKIITPMVDGEGRVTHFISTGRDITEEVHAQEELRRSEERFALAAQGANDGLWDWDLREERVFYSERWKSMVGCEPGEIGDRPDEWTGRIHPDDLQRFHAELNAHLDDRAPHFETEYRMRHRDGSWRWMLARGLAVRDAAGRPYRMVGSLTDITARKEGEARLLHSALHDSLTGLPNRVLFMDRLGQAIHRARRVPDRQFAVLFLDLDRFKIVNDSLGHALGDRLLVETGGRLSASLRPADTVARLGGDEFAILLDEIREPADAMRFADRVQKSLQEPFLVEGREVYSTASIGIALSSLGYERPEDMLRDADTAMYRAKVQGKARFAVFDRAMHEQALALLELETDLRRAAERHDFLLHYQPIISLRTGKIAGFEALLRWDHPTKGFIPPTRFIPLAEETGLIIPIGNRVLREACRQLRAWQGKFPQSPALQMSVNLSGVQMLQPELIMQIEMALRDFGLDGRSLKLEITESVIMEHAQYAREMLQQMKSQDIRLAIDDFGTGYSSMSYLRRYPIDTVKVDQSFVAKVNVDEESLEIVRSIISMAHNLKMDVVAEGVETPEQLARMRTLGCEYAQGFFFSRAVDKDAAEALLGGGWSW